MIKLGLIVCMLSFWTHLPMQTREPLSGIYIMTTPAKKMPCSNEAKLIVSNHKICISKKPIVAAAQLTYATDIQYDPRYQMHFIDIGLSTAGSSILAQTIESLPDTQFALALNDQVICVFKLNSGLTVRSFRIGNDIQLKDLTTIHEVLKNVKFN